jgi:hypothetical protein
MRCGGWETCEAELELTTVYIHDPEDIVYCDGFMELGKIL